MVTGDPAFLWETEVLRSATRPSRREGPPDDVTTGRPGDWLTLREASDTTGVPTSTLRNWARREDVESFVARTPQGPRRLVSLRDIKKRATETGRNIEPSGPSQRNTPPPSHERLEKEEQPTLPEDSMLVPIDAWNRMLNQLGNLHEAGQQLAEARERAAKAETEARFLKERLAGLREELEQARDRVTDPPSTLAPTTEDGVKDAPASATSLLRKAYRAWRDKPNR